MDKIWIINDNHQYWIITIFNHFPYVAHNSMAVSSPKIRDHVLSQPATVWSVDLWAQTALGLEGQVARWWVSSHAFRWDAYGCCWGLMWWLRFQLEPPDLRTSKMDADQWFWTVLDGFGRFWTVLDGFWVFGFDFGWRVSKTKTTVNLRGRMSWN